MLLDLGLPNVAGFEIARALRKRIRLGYRVVAFTGFSSTKHRERAKGCGIEGFVTKLFQPAQLEALAGSSAGAQPKALG